MNTAPDLDAGAHAIGAAALAFAAQNGWHGLASESAGHDRRAAGGRLMTAVDPIYAQWLMAEALWQVSTDAALVARWGATAVSMDT